MKLLLIYPRFNRHADDHPELRQWVPMNEYLGSPSLGVAQVMALTPDTWEVEYRDDRLTPADAPTDADLVALSFFTAAASRGMELARHFRALGKPVVAGGIFPTMMPDVVQPHVDAVVVGEAEGAWLQVLEDFALGRLAPRYHAAPVDPTTCPVPKLQPLFDLESARFAPDDYPLQLSRGCPLHCEACALPTTMGGVMRALPLGHVLAQLDQLDAAGKRACLTEDTSWLPGHDGRRRLQELLQYLVDSDRRALVSYVGTSLPMIRVTPPKLLDLAKRAGVDMFYLVTGFDPLSQRAFGTGDPKMWALSLDAVRRAHDCGIVPYTSFLLGGDVDEEGTVDRMLEFAHQAGITKAEFAIATPYPNTPRWHQLEREGRIHHRDWARYNDANCVYAPRVGTADGVTEGYLRLWREFYSGRDDLRALSVTERTIQF